MPSCCNGRKRFTQVLLGDQPGEVRHIVQILGSILAPEFQLMRRSVQALLTDLASSQEFASAPFKRLAEGQTAQ